MDRGPLTFAPISGSRTYAPVTMERSIALVQDRVERGDRNAQFSGGADEPPAHRKRGVPPSVCRADPAASVTV